MKYQAPTTIEEAIVECTPSINKLVRKFTRNHYYLADDLRQNAYLAVMDAFERYDRSKANKFSTYAYPRIACYLRDSAQTEWHNMNVGQEFTLDRHDNGFYDLDTNKVDIERQLNKLSDKHHAVFELRMAGLSFDEIASELGFNNLQAARRVYKEAESAFA